MRACVPQIVCDMRVQQVTTMRFAPKTFCRHTHTHTTSHNIVHAAVAVAVIDTRTRAHIISCVISVCVCVSCVVHKLHDIRGPCALRSSEKRVLGVPTVLHASVAAYKYDLIREPQPSAFSIQQQLYSSNMSVTGVVSVACGHEIRAPWLAMLRWKHKQAS